MDRLPSSELTESLGQIEGHPWAEWGRTGKPITQNALARQLKKFRTAGGLPIAPDTIRIGDRTPKGYLLSQFEDAFTRYSPKTSLPTATPQQAYSQGHFFDFPTATPESDVAVGKHEEPLSHGHCCGVAAENPSPMEETIAEAAPNLSGPSGHTCAQCGLDDGQAAPHPAAAASCGSTKSVGGSMPEQADEFPMPFPQPELPSLADTPDREGTPMNSGLPTARGGLDPLNAEEEH